MPRVVDAAHQQAAASDARAPQSSSRSNGSTQASQQQQQQPAQQQHQDPAMAVLLCTGGYDNTIRFWEAWSGICSRTIQHPESQLNKLAISPDKRFIATAGNQSVKIYDLTQPPQPGGNTPPVASLDSHSGNVTAVAWQSEARWLVTASEDGTLKIWDPRIPKAPQRNFDHKSPVNDCVIHPNQGELVSCDQSGAVKIWDLGGRSLTHELGFVYVWNMQTGRELTDLQPRTKFQAHNKYLLRCLLAPNGKLLATCSADKTVKIWNMEPQTATLDKTLVGHQRWVWDMAFSADSAYLVSASSDHYARLWELASGATVKQYAGHHKAVSCVALNDSP